MTKKKHFYVNKRKCNKKYFIANYLIINLTANDTSYETTPLELKKYILIIKTLQYFKKCKIS